MDNFDEESFSDHSVSQDVIETIGPSDFIQLSDGHIFMVEITLGNVLNLDEVCIDSNSFTIFLF